MDWDRRRYARSQLMEEKCFLIGPADLMTDEGGRVIAPRTDLAGHLLEDTMPADVHHLEIALARAPTPGCPLAEDMGDRAVARRPIIGAVLEPLPVRPEATAQALTAEDDPLREDSRLEGRTESDPLLRRGDLDLPTVKADRAMSPGVVPARDGRGTQPPGVKTIEQSGVIPPSSLATIDSHELHLREANRYRRSARKVPPVFPVESNLQT